MSIETHGRWPLGAAALVGPTWALAAARRQELAREGAWAIGRLEDGRIVEDWGSTDSVELLRQLGVWRSLLMVVIEWRLLFELARS